MGIEEVKKYIEKRKKLLHEVKELIIERLGLDLIPEEIDDDSPLFGMGLGLDSVDALDLVVGVEDKFGVQIGEGELLAFRSVNSLVDYILNKEGGNEDGTQE